MKDKLLAKLRRRVPEEGDARLLSDMLAQARMYVKAYTGLGDIPDTLDGAVLLLALVYYNRAGTEGEAQRTEGGVSRTFDSPMEHIHTLLRPYRKAKVGF